MKDGLPKPQRGEHSYRQGWGPGADNAVQSLLKYAHLSLASPYA